MLPLLLFLIFISTIYFTVYPFFSDNNHQIDSDKNQKESSKNRQLKTLFRQIREIEFEHEMGITVDEDFNRTRDELKLEASKLMEKSTPLKQNDLLTCKKCNHENDPNSKFCSNCGVNLLKRECSKCKMELKDLDKFCSQCGTSI